MTRKKFIETIFDALCAFREKAHSEDGSKEWVNSPRFKNARSATICKVDPDGKNEVGHYILIELDDGTFWRLTPERVLTLNAEENILWEDLKASEAQSEILDVEDQDTEEDSDETPFTPDNETE